MTSFTRKHLKISIKLDGDKFDDGKSNLVELEGYRCSVNIQNDGWENAQGMARIIIWGVPEALLNKMYQLPPSGGVSSITNRGVRVEAMDDEKTGYITVYEGAILSALPNYNAAPNVPLVIESTSTAYLMWHVPPPNSHEGTSDVPKRIESLAKQIGFTFKNNGVSAKLSNHYTSGSVISQIRDLARAAKIMCNIENKTVSIWPNGRGNGAPGVKINVATGMIGYPQLEYVGATVRCLFNFNLDLGREVELTSSVKACNGKFYVQKMNHTLESELPGGQWLTEVFLTKEAYFVTAN